MRVICFIFLFFCCEAKPVLTSNSNTDTLLTIAKHGLPTTSDPKHVIIIGAGIAGLTAGKLLKDAGHRVTILEASNRIGGRICTYRDPDNKFYADLGAMRIPYTHKFTKAYVDHFNLPTNEFINQNKNTWCYINGKKLRTFEVDDNLDVLGFDTTSKERGKSPVEQFSSVINKVIQKCIKEGAFQDNCVREYDRYSAKEYLKQETVLSNEDIAMIGLLKDEEAVFNLAFSERIRFYGVGNRLYEIAGGNDLLPKAFLPTLKHNITFNARVTLVEHGNGTVVVHYPSAGRDVAISGDYLLTTATATSTNFIDFSPILKADKQTSFRSINYISSTKIVLVFQRPFWEDEGIYGGNTVTDLPSRSIFYPSHDFDSGLGVVLASYTYGSDSTKFIGLSDDECLEQALKDLATIHGDNIRELYLEGVVKKWSLDRYSLGAFAALTPYQFTDLHEPLVRPQGNLFFAGEHTNSPNGFIDTAIKSAIEAAKCISTQICYLDLVE